MGTRITLLFQKPGLWGVRGKGRHAGPGQPQKLTAHAHLPSTPASRPGLCTFQKERSERREGAGAGAKAPGAAPLTLSEDGRLRRARWRLPCKKGHAESRGAEQERTREGRQSGRGRQSAGGEREREKVNRGSEHTHPAAMGSNGAAGWENCVPGPRAQDPGDG